MELFFIFHLLLLNHFVTGISISQTKCVEYGNTAITNETVDDAGPRAYSFMVKIYGNNSNTKQFLGMLISENFVLSTASKLTDFLNPVVILRDVRPGENLHTVSHKTYDVIETFVHPNFNADNLSSNIKLFKLNESIKFDDSVRPVCLPPFDVSIPKDIAQIGWGDADVGTADFLCNIKTNVISNESCKSSYVMAGASKFVSDIDNGTIFCARSEKGDQKICDRLDGSPLINVNHNGSDIVVGLASYSLKYFDDNTATIFVRVSAYIDWIENIVWGDAKPLETTIRPTANLTLGSIASNTIEPEILDNGMNPNSTETSQSVRINNSNTTELVIHASQMNTNATKTEIALISEANTNTAKPDLSAGGVKSNGTETLIPVSEANTNATKPNLPLTGVKPNGTETLIPVSEGNTNSTKPNLSVGGVKSNETETVVPVSEENTNATKPNLSVEQVKSNSTEPEMPDSRVNSNTSNLELSDGETISSTIILAILISLIVCVSCVVYLKNSKSRERGRSHNNYYSCYYDKNCERSALIESNV